MSRSIRYNPYHKQHRRRAGKQRMDMKFHECRSGAISPDPYDDASVCGEVWMAELDYVGTRDQHPRTREEGARFNGAKRLPKCKDRRKARRQKQCSYWGEFN